MGGFKTYTDNNDTCNGIELTRVSNWMAQTIDAVVKHYSGTNSKTHKSQFMYERRQKKIEETIKDAKIKLHDVGIQGTSETDKLTLQDPNNNNCSCY